MRIRDIFVTICVFFIFVNIAMLGFSTAIDMGISQILFVANIFLLSCVFYTSLSNRRDEK